MDDEAVETIRGQVRERINHYMTPQQVRDRLEEFRGFVRPTRAQWLEIEALEEAVTAQARGQAAIAAYQSGNTGMLDQARPAPNPVPGGEAGHGGWATGQGPDRHLQQHRSAAMRVLDHYRGTGMLDSAAADRADKVLRHGDGQALTARYLAAVGNEAYGTAFGKMVSDPVSGHLRFSAAEVEAVREATGAHSATIMGATELTTSTGFPLPLTVDPSIVITGTGALNPVRDVADVVTIGTHDWQGVTADSVVASYVAEGVEATDVSPALLGPKISSQQGRAVVTFSIEASQDWGTLQSELLKLVADGKNTVDATMFLTGTGTNQPGGILNIGGTNGLTTTQRVQTATVATLAPGDSWLLKGAIPARFIGSTTFAAAPATWDALFQLVPAGSTTLAQQFADSDRGGPFLGRPKIEWSAMGTGATTGTKLIIGGNFKGYKIVDRLGGITAELIPHMLGATRLPLGVRGLYAYWRCGAGVISANHFRYLEVK